MKTRKRLVIVSPKIRNNGNDVTQEAQRNESINAFLNYVGRNGTLLASRKESNKPERTCNLFSVLSFRVCNT